MWQESSVRRLVRNWALWGTKWGDQVPFLEDVPKEILPDVVYKALKGEMKIRFRKYKRHKRNGWVMKNVRRGWGLR